MDVGIEAFFFFLDCHVFIIIKILDFKSVPFHLGKNLALQIAQTSMFPNRHIKEGLIRFPCMHNLVSFIGHKKKLSEEVFIKGQGSKKTKETKHMTEARTFQIT